MGGPCVRLCPAQAPGPAIPAGARLAAGHPGYVARMTMTTPTLGRPQSQKVIAGVCAGLAERYGWRPGKVRLLFVLSCLLPGPQVVLYLALWMMLPKRP